MCCSEWPQHRRSLFSFRQTTHLIWLSTVVLKQPFQFFNTVPYLKADLLVLTTWFDAENNPASPASKFTLQCLYRSDQCRADYTSRIIVILYLFLLLAPINSSFCTTDRIKRCYLVLQNCLNLLRFCWIPRILQGYWLPGRKSTLSRGSQKFIIALAWHRRSRY